MNKEKFLNKIQEQNSKTILKSPTEYTDTVNDQEGQNEQDLQYYTQENQDDQDLQYYTREGQEDYSSFSYLISNKDDFGFVIIFTIKMKYSIVTLSIIPIDHIPDIINLLTQFLIDITSSETNSNFEIDFHGKNNDTLHIIYHRNNSEFYQEGSFQFLQVNNFDIANISVEIKNPDIYMSMLDLADELNNLT